MYYRELNLCYHSLLLFYVGGRYCHQTSSLFTIRIITNKYTTGRQQKKEGQDRIGNSLHGNIQKRTIKENHIHRRTYIQKKNIHKYDKLRNLYTGINIHPTQTHMIAEPFD